MSNVRVLVGTRKGAFVLYVRREARALGASAGRTSRAGKSITSRDRRRTRTAFTPPRRAAGSGR